MAPPKINATRRYVPEGTRKIYFASAVVDYTAPTRSEMDAGFDLTDEIAEITGFTVTSATADVPDLATRFTPKIPARITADDSSIRFWMDEESDDVRTVLPRDTQGFVFCLWDGDHTGHLMDVFPISVSASVPQTGIEDPASVEVQFTVTAIPAQNVAIPA